LKRTYMNTLKDINESLNTNHQVLLSVTLHPPSTYPISDYRTEFLLNVKDTSPQEIDEKCFKLNEIIKTWTYGLFFKELITDSLRARTQ